MKFGTELMAGLCGIPNLALFQDNTSASSHTHFTYQQLPRLWLKSTDSSE